jgi:hypothetical protein
VIPCMPSLARVMPATSVFIAFFLPVVQLPGTQSLA